MGWNWKQVHNAVPLCRGPTKAAVNRPEPSLLLVPADVATSGWKVGALETAAMTHSRVNRKSGARRFGASSERFSALSKTRGFSINLAVEITLHFQEAALRFADQTIKTRFISVNSAPEQSTADDVRADHV